MEDSKNVENIDDEIERNDVKLEKLKMVIKKLKIDKKDIKYSQDRKLRLKSNNGVGTNVEKRMARTFYEKMLWLDKKRNDDGRSLLSMPKKTHLIIKHLEGWPIIESAILLYNPAIEDGKGGFKDE